jgi:CSLREA domain-containing protein
VSLGLIIIFLAHSAILLAAPNGFRPPQINSTAAVLKPFGLTLTVNTTGDADALNPNTDCDTDAGTPGEQCTLRAAIQRANAVAGEDSIEFAIPSDQANCDPVNGKCTIKLTKALPDLSTDIVIDGPGADKLTVQRDTGGDYGIFRVTTTGEVTVAHIRIERGNFVNGVAAPFSSLAPLTST